VIDGERHIAARLHRDPLLIALLHHHGAPLELADPEDRRLRLVDDDRCGEEAAAHAVIGDREGAAPHIRRRQFAGARALHEIIQSARGIR
jgi:hypothetical protein